jgi:hypothetical protein
MKTRLSLRRRAVREDRDNALVANPQFEQNAMSPTTWSQYGHSSGAPEPGSCPSCSSAAYTTTRRASSANTVITMYRPNCTPCGSRATSINPNPA